MDQHNMTTHAACELYERRGTAEGHDLADLLEGIRMIEEPGYRDEESGRSDQDISIIQGHSPLMPDLFRVLCHITISLVIYIL